MESKAPTASIAICLQKSNQYIITLFCSLPLIHSTKLPPHKSSLKPSLPTTSLHITKTVNLDFISPSMASHKTLPTFFILSLLLFATFTSACDICHPKPTPTPKPKPEKCPIDTLKLGVCADLLGLVNVVVGTPATSPCCAVLEGLVDLEAALCLCTAIKANVLGINIQVPVALSAIVSACQKSVPPGFQCP